MTTGDETPEGLVRLHLYLKKALKRGSLGLGEKRRMKGIEIVLGIGVLYTSGMVVLTRNAVSSVIYLVGTIINGGIIFMKLGISIIPLIYIIVYVGGISILFLFVIMMVELHKEREVEGTNGIMLVVTGIIMTGMIYVSEVREKGRGIGGILKVEEGYRSMRWEGSTMTMEMIKSIGYLLYSENIMALIGIGFVLLMVMMSLRLLLKV